MFNTVFYKYYEICTSSTGIPTNPEDSHLSEGQIHSLIMEVQQNFSNVALIGIAVGGTLAVIIIAALIVAVCFLVRKQQRLEAGQYEGKVRYIA